MRRQGIVIICNIRPDSKYKELVSMYRERCNNAQIGDKNVRGQW